MPYKLGEHRDDRHYYLLLFAQTCGAHSVAITAEWEQKLFCYAGYIICNE